MASKLESVSKIQVKFPNGIFSEQDFKEKMQPELEFFQVRFSSYGITKPEKFIFKSFMSETAKGAFRTDKTKEGNNWEFVKEDVTTFKGCHGHFLSQQEANEYFELMKKEGDSSGSELYRYIMSLL